MKGLSMSLTVALLVCGLSVLVTSSILLTCAYRLMQDLASLFLPVGIGGWRMKRLTAFSNRIWRGFWRGYADYVLWMILALAIWHSLRSLSMLD